MPSLERHVRDWPEQSREAAQLVAGKYGEPQEATPTQLTWHRPGPWKRIVATREYYAHDFPVPHIDAVESVVDYRRKKPTPCMEGLRFELGGNTRDPDQRVLSDEELAAAAEEGRKRS